MLKSSVMGQNLATSDSITNTVLIFMNNTVQANIHWLSSGALSIVSTRMYCQLKYSDWSVLMESINNYVLPTDSTVTGQSCHPFFLHSTDIGC